MDRLTIKEAISFCKQGKEVILRNDDYEDLVLVDYEDGYLKDIVGDSNFAGKNPLHPLKVQAL